MELQWVLQYFLAVAREQSIIRAAESLHLSQPHFPLKSKIWKKNWAQLLIRGTKGSRKVNTDRGRHDFTETCRRNYGFG